MEVVHGAPNHLGEHRPRDIGYEHTDRANNVAALILFEVGNEWTEILRHHALVVDEILPAAGAVLLELRVG